MAKLVAKAIENEDYAGAAELQDEIKRLEDGIKSLEDEIKRLEDEIKRLEAPPSSPAPTLKGSEEPIYTRRTNEESPKNTGECERMHTNGCRHNECY